MKIKIVGAIIIVLAGGLFYLYYRLGGFETYGFEVVKVEGYQIAGKPFEGKYYDPVMGDIFVEVKESINKPGLEGTLVIVNYQIGSEKSKGGMIKQFVGVLLEKSSDMDLPDGFEWRKIEAGKAIRTLITSHNLVMPKPETLQQKAEEVAITENVQLQGLTIEQYISDRELVIEWPVMK